MASTCAHFLTRFARSESGAVTVDWVVLTSALVGLGIASVAVVSAGVENSSEDIAGELADTSISTRFASFSTTSLFDSGFEDGAGGWIGGFAQTLSGFGEVLMIAGGDTATLNLSVPPGASSATISFDMIAGDDLDAGDTATVFVNGQAVSFYTDDHGNVSITDEGVSGISLSVESHGAQSQLGAGSHGHDTRATYTITVDDPGSSVSLAVASGANESIGNEFYAIDDVSVVAN